MKDKIKHNRDKIISIALLSGVFGILVTCLQIDSEVILKSNDLTVAIMLFSVLFPILLIDVFMLSMNELQHSTSIERTSDRKYVRWVIWLITGFGITKAFNHLPNASFFSSSGLMITSFVLYFLYIIFPHFINNFKKNRNPLK